MWLHIKRIKKLDAGFHFTDINGRHIYRGHQQAKILTFDELLEMYLSKYINVDLKDAPSSYEGSIAPKNVWYYKASSCWETCTCNKFP